MKVPRVSLLSGSLTTLLCAFLIAHVRSMMHQLCSLWFDNTNGIGLHHSNKLYSTGEIILWSLQKVSLPNNISVILYNCFWGMVRILDSVLMFHVKVWVRAYYIHTHVHVHVHMRTKHQLIHTKIITMWGLMFSLHIHHIWSLVIYYWWFVQTTSFDHGQIVKHLVTRSNSSPVEHSLRV
jgi:hypothetical protein